jgi:hypothetical protein
MWKAWALAAAFVAGAALFILTVEPPAAIVPPAGPLQFFRDCEDCPEMVRIEPGVFRMGAEPRRAARSPSLSGTRASLAGGVTVTFPQTRAGGAPIAR